MGKFEKKCKREENVKICGLKTENISKISAGMLLMAGSWYPI